MSTSYVDFYFNFNSTLNSATILRMINDLNRNRYLTFTFRMLIRASYLGIEVPYDFEFIVSRNIYP